MEPLFGRSGDGVVPAVLAVLAAVALAASVRAAEPVTAPTEEAPAVEAPAPPVEEPAEDESALSFEMDLTLNGKYVWRGINLTDEPVAQPSVTFGYGEVSLNVWGNADLTNVNGYRREFNEVDYTLDWTHEFEGGSFSLGAIYYTFPNTGFDPTTELYLGFSVDAPLEPSLTIYRDIDLIDGWYASLGVGHTFEGVAKPSEDVSMDVAVSAAVGAGDSDHNAAYYGVAKDAITDAQVSVSMPIHFGDRWTLTPSATQSVLVDHRIRNAMPKPDNFWMGLSLTFSF